MTTPRPIIIDTDPGQDDAAAILLALASPELEVLGITTVAGNVPLVRTTCNARLILDPAGRPDLPLRSGAAMPLRRQLVTAEHVHGGTGLDGWDWPEPKAPVVGDDAAAWIARTVMAAPAGTITLCPLGPLTNIARAMEIAPELPVRLREIVLMGGGCFEGGNITPAAEFNVFVDPEAAGIVFASGANIVMAPLDVTHKALMPRAFLDGLAGLGTEVGRACAGMLGFFERFDVEKYGSTGGPLHDPCVIAYLLRPDLFTGRDCFVGIETRDGLTLGATVIDWWGVWPDRAANAHVLSGVDAEALFALILERLARL